MFDSTAVEAARDRISYDLILVGPELAREMAAASGLSFDRLRPNEQAVALGYATSMKTGRWAINGDAVILAEDGRTVLDGRKRILAAAHYGCSFPTLRVFGVDADARITIGEHRKRSAAVALYVAGDDSAGTVAAAATAATSIAANGRLDPKSAIPSNLIPELVFEHPEIAAAVETMKSTVSARQIGVGLASALRYLADVVDPDLAKRFFDELEASFLDPSTKGIPRVLADALIGTQDRRSHDSSSARRYRVLYFVKAWNAYHDGKTLSQLQIKANESVSLMRGLSPDLFSEYRTKQETSIEDSAAVVAEYKKALAASKAAIAIKVVDPEWARMVLDRNGPDLGPVKRNRRLSKATVARYARDMAAGRWRINGQAIKISTNGRLIDGQHRLNGVVETGLPIPMLVATGIDQKAFTTLDLGATRAFAEHLRAIGVAYPNQMQGATRLVWQQSTGVLGDGRSPSNSDLLSTWEQHPELDRYARKAADPNLQRLLGSYIVIGVLYMLSIRSREAADEFLERLKTGSNLKGGSPILALRNRLIGLSSGKRGLSSERVKLLLIMKSWMAWREGREMDVVKAMQTERFPASFLEI